MKSLLSSGRVNAASTLRLCLNSLQALACCFLADSQILPASAAQPQVATQFDFSTDTRPGARKFYFETIPGHRYTLWRSTDLKIWSPVPGYPQTAAGLSIEHTFAQDTKEFFRVEPIDDQAPTVAAQYPAMDGFAVGRFADLEIELSDATGIDPASIRLTVGASGQLAPGAPGLTISGNTITYDSGDSALGAWGATLSATLVVSDTIGHTLTHTWSFRLEPEPQVAANIFVFGSPTAQRSGQRVSGPAAALASRFPAPVGPVRANDPPPWEIESVLADRIVISFEAGGAPSFAVGQLICNLAPTKESEIFYRRVVSSSNDAANLKLTVLTEDIPITDLVSQGSCNFNENSVVYDVDEIGIIVRAVGGTLPLSKKTINLSGSSYKLRSDGYEANLLGIGSYSIGSEVPWLEVSLPDYQWSFQPTIKADLEIRNGLSCEVIVSGTNSLSAALEAKVILLSASTTTTLYNLPPEKEPFKLVYLGQMGPIPVWAVLKFDFSIKSKAQANAVVEVRASYKQEHYINAMGFSYNPIKGAVIYRDVHAAPPVIKSSAAFNGEFSLELSTDPRIEFLISGLAGIKAGLEGKVGIETNVSYGTGGGDIGGKLTAEVNSFVGTAGPTLDFLGVHKEVSWRLWEDEWPLTPKTLAFTTHPQSRNAAPGDFVSFTCSVDSPSPPTFQWYQNGLVLPRQTSRSLFLDRVTTGFAGNYFVRVKAGNQSIDSEVASLTVQAVTPETLDTDRDGVPDIYETNTGVWGSATNRGTDPFDWDSDDDGLSDGVENRSFYYVSPSNTGTDPNLPDSDADGVNDKTEIDRGRDPNRGISPVATAATVAAGMRYSLFVKIDGTLWAMGYNYSGQLGDGTTESHTTPVQVATGVAQVSAGAHHSLFVKTDGTLWAMGSNSSGQLGDGTGESRTTPVQVATGVAQAAAGGIHSLFLKTNGTLWAMGSNSTGQLGDGTMESRTTPIQVATGVAQAVAGQNRSFFVKTDGALWSTGLNSSGQLGDGTTESRTIPVQVASGVAQATAGYNHSHFVKTDGTLWAMGSNSLGQLGDGTTESCTIPVQVASEVSQASAGSFSTHFVKSDRTLWAMGRNNSGQLGDGTSETRITPVQVATGASFVASSIFPIPIPGHRLFKKVDGTLWGMGRNDVGQLGIETASTNQLSPIQIATGL